MSWGKLQVLCREEKACPHISFSLWPNDLSPCDHCASNGGLMPNKNHWDDKCDVKRSFLGFCYKFSPRKNSSHRNQIPAPFQDLIAWQILGAGDPTPAWTPSPRDLASQTQTQRLGSGGGHTRKLVDQTYFVVSFAGFKIPSRILLKVCDSWYPLSKPD